ncbi:MAG: hypothetical protein M3Q19_14610 [Pseudomonadota bacterium]|nr:hypothetical protein [Pseudomonadota bacterium]
MRRPQKELRGGATFFPVLFNFTQEQLAGIGAVAMTFNAAEKLIDDLVRIGWQLKFDANEIITRIGGIDGKYELVKHAAKVWGMPADLQEALQSIFSKTDFQELKSLRDSIVHARIVDADRAVGVHLQRQNKRAEILLSAEALSGVARRLEIIANELEAIKQAYGIHIDLKFHGASWPQQDKERLEGVLRDSMTQYQRHRTNRKTLPPLPEFPEGPEPSELWAKLLDGRSDQSEPTA